MRTLPKKLGVIGCGNIFAVYAANARRLFGDYLELVACADLDPARARARAAEFGVPRALSVEELLADPDIELVLNLTVPAAHGEIARRALAAGKHVYNEKPLALDRAEARALLALAAQAGRRVGAAPDTFLGASLQTCRQLIDEGVIGEPVGAAGCMTSPGVEGWHPDPGFFYQPGGGPLFDMGPYYLTALCALLGPVRRVTGSARISFPERLISSQPRAGQRVPVNTPTHLACVLDFAAGPVGTLTTSFDVCGASRAHETIEIYGREGTLLVPDPNRFGEPVYLRPRADEGRGWQEVRRPFPYAENSRGLGLADLAAALAGGRPHRASGELALHVLEVMHAVLESSARGTHVVLDSAPERPAAWPAGLREGQVDP